MTKMNANNKND